MWYLLSIASGFFYLQKSIYCENSILCCIVRYSDQCKKLKKAALYIPFSISTVYKKCNAEGNYLLVPQRTERKRDFGRFYGVISRTQRIWQSCKSLWHRGFRARKKPVKWLAEIHLVAGAGPFGWKTATASYSASSDCLTTCSLKFVPTLWEICGNFFYCRCYKIALQQPLFKS